MITNIFFDLDGVLVDAVGLHQRSFLMAIKTFGIDMTEEEHMNLFNGRPTKEKLNMLVESNRLSKSDSDKIFSIKQSITNDLISSDIHPMQNVIDTVGWAKGFYSISIFSNSIRSTIIKILSSAGLYEFFKNSTIISNEDINYPKPDPSGYLKLLEINRCEPHNVVVVEDTELGALSAINANIKNVLIVNNPGDLNLIKLKEFINDCNHANGRHSKKIY